MSSAVVVDGFDYRAPAELFAGRARGRKKRMWHRRFETAAEAIRFVVEEIPAPMLSSMYLQIDDARFGADEMRDLYVHAGYPLARPAA